MKSFKFLCAAVTILLISGMKGFSQVKTYQAEWKTVNELIQKKNLPKSALETVKKIYAMAKKEKQDAQVVKALIYMTGLQDEIREDNTIRAIREIEKEVLQQKEPAASILKSYLATLYWQYFQNHRWQLYKRTNTVNFAKEDIATWTSEDLHKRISELYLQSLEKKTILKATSLQPFEAIIIKGNVRHLRPTLYDLLAHKALDYFKNDERDIQKPAYAFEISNPDAFAPADLFVKTSFPTKDTLSLHHKALLLYQELIAFHLKDARPDALIDLDLDRIQFVYQNAVHENKDALYISALEKIATKYNGNPTAAQAWYLQAAHYEEQAASYAPFRDTTNQYARVKAKNILERVVKDSSVKSEGWINSFNLLNEIKKPSFSFEIEKVNVPGQPFRSLINYRNITALNLKLVKADDQIKNEYENRYDEGFWNALINAKAIRTWQQTLPQTNDLQQHKVEIKIDALPAGEYFLIASPDQKMNSKKSVLGARLFHVSNISYINRDYQFFVFNRETGQPLSGATVQAWQRTYDYSNYKYTRKEAGKYTADQKGYVNIPVTKKENESFYVDVLHGNEKLSLDELFYHYSYYDPYDNRKTDEVEKIFFFTDRSIYRPAQTVYFKGIVLVKRKEGNRILTGYKTTVYLQDANSEAVDSIEVTTNEFGSFSGKFQLPETGLTGSFEIVDKEEKNYVSFSVEEYKRPRFYVDFDKVKESYKVGDSITLTGNAKAYAGNTVGGAQVSYRVVRQPRYLYPWLFRGWWFPRTEAMEIAHGQATTNQQGQFRVTFKAIPDPSIDKKFDPLFDYTIYADVTDINGETRSAANTVSAGYKSVLLLVDARERVPVDSFHTLQIQTVNQNGTHQPSTITVTVSKLLPEQRLIRNRYWEQPDQFVFSKEEFIRHFPYDEYRDESDFRNWQKGPRVFSRTDSSSSTGNFPVSGHKLTSGFYQLEIVTKDKEGQEVKDIQFIELYDPKNKELNRPVYLWTNKVNNELEPGKKATVQIGSSASDVYLVQFTHKGEEEQTEFATSVLNKEKKDFDYSVTEKDRGGFGVGFFFVKHNRVHQYTDIIQVPWSNKELNIEYATFRDKTLPGSEEKWKVKISGYKGDKVAAEMLASMYDASLDQFSMHKWNKPSIWDTYTSVPTWNGSQNFSKVESDQKWQVDNAYRQYEKQYDELNFSFERPNPRRRLAEVAMSAPVMAGNAKTKTARREKEEERMDVGTATAADSTVRAETDKLLNADIADDGKSTSKQDQNPVQIRKNFNETAFFFPDLKTDKDGNIEFSFTLPEALTRWKLQTLAHTKDLALGISQKEMVTQKQLMVQPNAPRFLREGDRMEFSAKIVNLSEKEFTGQAELQLIDATTNQSVDGWFQNIFPNQYFTVAAGQSEVVKFPIEVPYNFNKALIWRVVAKAQNFSDGEEMALPVLTNKMLVTETVLLPMSGAGTKNFTFEKLLKANSETLQHHALTVEFTSNPAWYAVQALPYLMETTHDGSEQVWNRYYANALASKIVNAAPKIKQIFSAWKTADTAALLSNLQKNEELKNALLEETPWVLEAKSEEQQKKNIALLFDLVRVSKELNSNLEKLKAMQSSNGGFVWFKGGPDDRYMTQYIITGIGHLIKLDAVPAEQEEEINSILKTAVPYLDLKIREDYANLIKYKADLKKSQIDHLGAQYLYMRSFFPHIPVSTATQTAYQYYRKQTQQFWMQQNKYVQGMIALALSRTGDKETPAVIINSLKETAITSEELGMYWKDNSYGRSWFWWHAPIETQALLIEVFSEIAKDNNTVDQLKTWLLKNKQTNNWRTTKATADACYAMLLQGSDWLSNEPSVTVRLGATTITSTNRKTEAGTGYFKERIEGPFIKPEMGNISVTVQPSATKSASSWGAVYWQYFENLDNITSASTPLQLSKKLFVEKNTDRGPVLSPLTDGAALKVGDKVKVRIEVRVDRDMEYVHMKDMRASSMEPVNVLSGYRWQGGLGYYEATKDLSTSFFFQYLRKGTYVFEYPLFVTHAGNFSNGITTIQSMYAPEFNAHSEGIRVNVEQ